MARTVEALKEKLAKEKARAAETAKKLRAAEKAKKARESTARRKAETRRKVILGGFLLAKMKQQNPQAEALHRECLESLTRPADRRAFDLDPLEKADD